MVGVTFFATVFAATLVLAAPIDERHEHHHNGHKWEGEGYTSSVTSSSTSYYVAPTTSSSSSSYSAAAKAVATPAAEEDTAVTSSDSYEYSGQATYFYQGGNAGACGNYNSDSSYVVAIDSAMYNGDLCGKKVKITNTATGATVTATVADECPTCASSGSLDLSVAAFQAIGNLNDGVESIKWSYA